MHSVKLRSDPQKITPAFLRPYRIEAQPNPACQPIQRIVCGRFRAGDEIRRRNAIFQHRQHAFKVINQAFQEVRWRALPGYVSIGAEDLLLVQLRQVVIYIREARTVDPESCDLGCLPAIAQELDTH